MSTSRTYVAGAVLTAAQMNDLPQGRLGGAQAVAVQSPITVEVDLTSLSVAVTVVAGRRIRITGTCLFQSSVVDDVAELRIKEGATTLQATPILCRPAATNVRATAIVELAPSVGAHTYKLMAIRLSGTGTTSMQAAATVPAQLIVEDIGV